MFGVTVTAGIMALGALAFGSTAGASTANPTASPTPTVTFTTDPYEWGPYYSKHDLASSYGAAYVNWNNKKKSNEAGVSGQLYDLDSSQYKSQDKCALVKFKVRHLNRNHWSDSYHKVWCGDNAQDYFGFFFTERNVRAIKVQLCQTLGEHSRYSFNCGYWYPVYS
ncbi:hypothetical protein J5X84_35665 [Streptosporangiaceae bacterium NEAU-GS5]|nr:hypothetical protein [Streptosporangiaceae bacterium NEAU-GS5]